MESENKKKVIEATLPTSSLWFGMVTPFLKMKLSAVLWYWGESNAYEPVSYACRFPAMISDWRKKFEQPELPFYFVQIAGCTNDLATPEIREA